MQASVCLLQPATDGWTCGRPAGLESAAGRGFLHQFPAGMGAGFLWRHVQRPVAGGDGAMFRSDRAIPERSPCYWNPNFHPPDAVECISIWRGYGQLRTGWNSWMTGSCRKRTRAHSRNRHSGVPPGEGIWFSYRIHLMCGLPRQNTDSGERPLTQQLLCRLTWYGLLRRWF